MKVEIRQALDCDKEVYIDFAIKLNRFNRNHHDDECKYDDYQSVLNSMRCRAEKTFINRDDDSIILIAELEGRPVGYALGRIFEEDKTADNGTGRIGLFDELYVDDAARGLGLGQKLIDEIIKWMKEKKIFRIKLHAYSWNHNAKKLYERNGFKEYAVSYERFI